MKNKNVDNKKIKNLQKNGMVMTHNKANHDAKVLLAT